MATTLPPEKHMNQAIASRLAADGSKIMVTLKFQFADVERATATICNRKVDALFNNGLVGTQRFHTTMTNRTLGRSGTSLCLLTEEQLETLLSEEEAPVTGMHELKDLFTFKIQRIPYPGRSRVVFFWGNDFLRDERSSSDQIECNQFVLTQLVRFGVLDKFPPRKK